MSIYENRHAEKESTTTKKTDDMNKKPGDDTHTHTHTHTERERERERKGLSNSSTVDETRRTTKK